MCGICGVISLKEGMIPSPENVRRMLGALKHRGPDFCGYYRDRKVVLGHTRLAIIDLETGTQPLSNEDETLWISFNGEIYNYIEIRDELVGKGHEFKTQSDTEVIVHAWEEWGKKCFNRFNGQWAVALWDMKKDMMVLSRDRLGIRPLYYTNNRDRIIFASEIKAIFTDSSIPRRFDGKGLKETFTLWSPLAPRTVYEGIFELEPGYVAEIRAGVMKKEPYWELSFPSGDYDKRDFESCREELRHLLIDSTKLRFERSDVDVGAYLSGGIDSSITSAVVAEYTDSPLKTFSIRFNDKEFDEGEYQNEMATRLGTDHEVIDVTYSDIGEAFSQVIRHTERPILRTAPAPLFMLSRLARDSGYKVVVTGEGSDEVLAGYDIYREAKVRALIAGDPDNEANQELVAKLYPWMKRSPGKTPAFARAFFNRNLDMDDPAMSHKPRWDTTSVISRLFSTDFRESLGDYDAGDEVIGRMPDNQSGWSGLSRAQWLEYKTLLPGYILSAQGDRMLMANSMEGRFPFLDYRLVEFANRLPDEYKLNGLNEKHILKEAFSDLIPESILKRPKQPYRSPDAMSFFGGQSLPWIEEVSSEEMIREAGIFNGSAISKLFAKCRRKGGEGMSNSDNMMAAAVLSTMLTYKHFIKEPQPEILISSGIRIIDKT